MQNDRFHGRVKGQTQICAELGCTSAGEFRAPTPYSANDPMRGPGQYAYYCLDHIRAFNARYDWFAGMSREAIEEAQRPAAGWENAARFFAQEGVDRPPKWADFHDPLDAISARFKSSVRDGVAARNSRFPADERRALKTLGLDESSDLRAVRASYSKLVRQYHPDRNGGDRRYEKKLQTVIEAYQLLKSSTQFAR